MKKRFSPELPSPKSQRGQHENSIKKVEQMIERNKRLMNIQDSGTNRDQLKKSLKMQIQQNSAIIKENQNVLNVPKKGAPPSLVTMRENIQKMNAVIKNVPKKSSLPPILRKNMSQQKLVPKISLVSKSYVNLQ